MGVHQGSALNPLLFVVVIQEATREARGEGLWDLLHADDLMITAKSEEEAVRGNNGEIIHVGFAAKELEQIQYGVNAVKGGATRDVRGSEI